MALLTLKTFAKAYIIAILLLGVLVSPLPQFALALALLALQLYTVYKPPAPSLNLALVIGTLIFTPLTLVPLAGSLLSALFTIPAVYLLDQSLHDNAASQVFLHSKTGRNATPVLKTVSAALFVVLVASFALLNETLLFATAILAIYLVAVLSYNFRKVPKMPLKESKTWNRVLVGNTVNTPMRLSTIADLPLSISLIAPMPWLQVEPSNLKITSQREAEVSLTFAPPLAGPAKLQLQALAVDPWGLIQIGQTLEPIDLNILPKAKYAQWLANKYLEQTASGTASAAAAPPPRAFKAAKHGVEYYGSHLYQPGDRLKDVDWKHTFMLDELIIKEFAGAQGQPAIIVADLTAKDPEDADKLAYNMVMSALTLATESLPSALAIYNQKEVIEATSPTNPREILKKTLKITEKITIIEQPTKALQPTEMRRLKRSMRQLDQIKTESIQKLTKILEFEYEATQTAAKAHPATQALTKCVDKTPPPALITVASSTTYEDALIVTLEKLKEKGYSTVQVST